jgi:hypothetical protein
MKKILSLLLVVGSLNAFSDEYVSLDQMQEIVINTSQKDDSKQGYSCMGDPQLFRHNASFINHCSYLDVKFLVDKVPAKLSINFKSSVNNVPLKEVFIGGDDRFFFTVNLEKAGDSLNGYIDYLVSNESKTGESISGGMKQCQKEVYSKFYTGELPDTSPKIIQLKLRELCIVDRLIRGIDASAADKLAGLLVGEEDKNKAQFTTDFINFIKNPGNIEKLYTKFIHPKAKYVPSYIQQKIPGFIKEDQKYRITISRIEAEPNPRYFNREKDDTAIILFTNKEN